MLAGVLAVGCASRGAEAELAAYVPAGAQIVAGAHVDAVRKSPLYGDFPAFVKDFIEPVGGASEMIMAMGNFGLVTLTAGKFPKPPAGFTQLRRGIMAAGTADQSGSYASGELLRKAPKQADVWIVAKGSATLPLTGTLANLNRFLHLTTETTGAATLTDHAEVRIVAFCADADRATVMEQTVRAFASLASAAGRHTGDVNVQSEGTEVHIDINLSREDFAKLLSHLGE